MLHLTHQHIVSAFGRNKRSVFQTIHCVYYIKRFSLVYVFSFIIAWFDNHTFFLSKVIWFGIFSLPHGCPFDTRIVSNKSMTLFAKFITLFTLLYNAEFDLIMSLSSQNPSQVLNFPRLATFSIKSTWTYDHMYNL